MVNLTKASVAVMTLAFALQPVAAQETAFKSEIDRNNPQVDYAGFISLTAELQSYRSKRLITMEQFNQLSQESGALILDTRSAAAFKRGHIAGAINLPFSDFTDEKLAQYLGNKSRPILIYCNNNFRDNIAPVVRKAVTLALNIPTFINLYGYGYTNIYELNDTVLMADPQVHWVRGAMES